MRLSTTEIQAIENICNSMIELIDTETLQYILEEPFDSEEGILSNDAFYEDEALSNSDFELVGEYAHHYLIGKVLWKGSYITT